MGRSRRQNKGGGLPDGELRKYVICLMVLSVALVLVAVVFLSAGWRDEPAELTTEATEILETESTFSSAIEPDTKEYVQEFEGSILSQDTIPEINSLMQQYFTSIVDCDMETFMLLFTSQDTSQTEVFRARFEQQRTYVEGYQNISCYVTQGLEPDTYVVYTYYETKFVDVDTPAPAMVQVYVVMGEDGRYRIFDQEPTPKLEEYINRISVNEDVRLLIAQVDRQMAQAEQQDPQLKRLVDYLKGGPPPSDDNTEAEGQGETSPGESTDQTP